MTREEQIKKQADIYTDDASNYTEWSDDGGWSVTNDIELVEKAFIEGAKWADENPKSSWISVKDDLPCNHEELMSAKYETKKVFVLKDSFGNPDIDYMIKENGKWRWFYYNSTKYWMPIPEPPKEQEIKLWKKKYTK